MRNMKDFGASLGDDSTTNCMACVELIDALKVAEKRARRYRKERNTAREELDKVKGKHSQLQKKVDILLA